MDHIKLTGLQFIGTHGVMPEEKKLGQPFIIDIDMEIDLTEAGRTDDLSKTVSYADIYEIVASEVTEKCYDLIERLCYRLVGLVLGYDPRIVSVEVLIKKPQAPIKGIFDYPSVCIKRGRNEIDLLEFRL